MNPNIELAEIGKYFADRKWSLATSSNYSYRAANNEILITKSGIDKQTMTDLDLVRIDSLGNPIELKSPKTSAETMIHTTIYNLVPNAKAVLHTHSVFGTRLSLRFLEHGVLKISGYEMLKGLSNISTHMTTEEIPVLENSQDMAELSKFVTLAFMKHPNMHGFLIAGHGLYTWGTSIAEAKRHIETYEFLFECLAYEHLGF